MKKKIFKSSELFPKEIRVADSSEFSIRLEIGEKYTLRPSRIVYDFSCTLGTSCPTRQFNELSGYTEVYVTNPDVEYKLRCWDLDHKYFVDQDHPPSREAMRMVVLDLSEGLCEGDTIELKWGETLGGFGPGAKVTSVVPRPDYRARIDVRYFDSQEKGIPDHGRDYIGYKRPEPDELIRLEYKILPRNPRRLRLLRKQDCTMLIPYDEFYNVSEIDDIHSLVECGTIPEKNKYSVFEYADKHIHVKPKSLNLTETPGMEDICQGLNIYWGDIHTHSAYSIDCAQRSGMDMLPSDLMDFAKYRAGLDFFAVTDHHIPHQEPIRHIGKEKWNATLDDIRTHHEDGKFVIFPGIEFTDEFGDICLIFNEFPEYDRITDPELKDVSDFYRLFGDKMLAIPHLHAPGLRPEGEWRQGTDPITPVLEIYSDHGSYEREHVLENGRAWCKKFHPNRCGEYFLKHGYKYGLVANSDDHKGHVGVNGLTAVYSKELTREGLFSAYLNRHVYGTTNARIRLIFTGNGRLMGSVLDVVDRKEFLIDVVGENRLKKVEVFRNGQLFKKFRPDGKIFKTELKVDEPEPDNWYVRVTQIDNHIAYSSPIWFE